MSRRPAAVGLLVLLAGPVAADNAEVLEPKLRAAIESLAAVSEFSVPQLDDEQLAELFAGEVVKATLRLPLPGAEDQDDLKYRVLAYYLIDEPMVRVWLAIHDPHFQKSDRFTYLRLADDGHAGSVTYGHVALPWPISDRHWVVRGRRAVEVAAATDNRIWEYRWNLAENGRELAREALEDGRVPDLGEKTWKKAVYLPASTGAWALLTLDDEHTVLAYQLTLVLGGMIPERLGVGFARRQLDSLARAVAETSRRVDSHYTADHAPLLGGDGRPIPRCEPPPPE